MKVFVSIALVFLLFTSFASGCAPEPPPDVPRYTADQVLEVAQAYNPGGVKTWAKEIAKQQGYPKWSTEYIGNGRWRIEKTWGNWGDDSIMYFDEESGSILR